MDRYVEIKNKIVELATTDSDIKAIVAIGSSTRNDIKADEFSDLDLIIATDDVEKWFSNEYPKLLGNVSVSFIEPTLGGGKERRCIYENDLDVDMIVFTPDQFKKALEDGVAGWVMNRGYKILYDSENFGDLINRYVKPGHSNPTMTEEEFVNRVNDFYFHNIWASKKLKRGEIWSAKMCVDAYLKNHLLKMIEFYCHKANGTDVWHDGRFIDRWAGEEIIGELKNCFAHYESRDIMKALLATHNLFSEITKKIAKNEGFKYPDKAEICAKQYLLS